MRIAVGLRLGTSISEPRNCPYGSLSAVDGSLGLSCGLGPGRFAPHAVFNDLEDLVALAFPRSRNHRGLSRTDDQRPERLALIPLLIDRSSI